MTPPVQRTVATASSKENVFIAQIVFYGRYYYPPGGGLAAGLAGHGPVTVAAMMFKATGLDKILDCRIAIGANHDFCGVPDRVTSSQFIADPAFVAHNDILIVRRVWQMFTRAVHQDKDD